MDPPLPFIIGQEVEVTSDEQGFEGSWFIATLIRKSTKKKKNFVVEYQTLVDDQGLKHLKEYVHLKHIRPLQPQGAPRLFKENEEVDAFYNDGWWKGVIQEVLEDSKYLVLFQTSNEAIVFKQSDLRVHMEWRDGKWVNSADDNQEAVERVEVKLDAAACRGAWFPATLLKKISDKSFLVDYKRSSFGNTIKHWTGIVDSINVRPLPPSSRSLHRETFDLLQKVEAFYNFGWLSGVITRVLPDEKYTVFFKHRNEEKEFKRSDLRLHMDWIDSKWFLDTRSQVSLDKGIMYREEREGDILDFSFFVEFTVLVPDEGNGNPTANPSLSTGMDTQVIPSVVIDKSLEMVTSCAGNDAGRMDYESAVSEDILFSSQKDTEQSTPKGNNDFLRPHMKVGGRKTANVSMSIKACSERGMSTGSCNDVEEHSMFSSPTMKGKRSKIEIRRARNSFSEFFFNSFESPKRDNHKSRDDLESKSFERKASTTSISHLNSDLMEVERSVVLSLPQSNVQCLEEQHVVLPTEQMNEISSTPGEDRVNKRSEITVKRKRGRPKGSGKKKKANTSDSQEFDIISQIKGPENEFVSNKNTNVQMQCSEFPSSTDENVKTQCSELPSSAVDNHQMPSVLFERSDTSAVQDRGTETEAANRNLVDEIDSMQLTNTKVDTNQTLNLDPKMSDRPINGGGLESELTCTENIVAGAVPEIICTQNNMQCLEEQHVVLPTEQMNEISSTPEEDRVNKQSEITVKRNRGRPKSSGKKKKANTSNYQEFGIISQLKGPENESTSNENTTVQKQCSELPSSTVENVEAQCSELPSSAVDNHQVPSVFFERSDTSAVQDRGTEIEAANRNLVDEIDSMQLINTNVDTDQTLHLDLEMSEHPINGRGLESESTCTENIAAGAVSDIACTPVFSPTIEEHQTLSPTPDHANRATECEVVLGVTTGQINQAQVLCPSILEKPLIVESNGDIQVALDEAMDERDTPVNFVMDLPQPSRDVEIASQNSPPLEINQEQQIQPFEKKSSMWKILEGLEAFKSNPQNPHFHPLENEQEELREGKALGLMCVFENLVTRTSIASIKEERRVFENRLVALNELDVHGFKVGLMRSKLERMIEIKDRLDELGNRPDKSKLKIEEAENQLKEMRVSIENLKLQLQILLAREEKVSRNLASFRRAADEAEERAHQLGLEFHDVASAP